MEWDPSMMGTIRRKQMAYINRYAPSGHPSAWDNTSVTEFVAYHDAVCEIIKAENKGSSNDVED